jgi:hypothetical protein
MRENRFQGYEAIDFLKKEDFLRWNLFKDKEDTTYWRSIMEENPKLIPAIEKAISLYETQVRLNDYTLAPEAIEIHHTLFCQRAEQRKKRRTLSIWFSAVASLLLLFAITQIYQNSKEQPSELLEFVKAHSILTDTISENIQLLVSSEEAIRIEEKEPTISYHSDSIRVTGKSVAEVNTAGYNRLIVPKGKRSRLMLSDGSTLHVNSGTEVIYPNRFTGNRREIYVNGEVFLEVMPDANQPFIVMTHDIEVRVLGTKFNVQAYEEDRKIEVVLASGSVQVTAGKNAPKTNLVPSEMYRYIEGQSSVNKVDVEKYISWIDGILYAQDERLDVLMTKLSRYYGKEIIYDESIVNQRCSGKIDLKSDLGEVLNGLTFSFPIETEYKNGIYRVRTK